MGLDRFVAREPRPLPIFVLVDTSGSMKGEKINELNLALREMLNALNHADDIRGKFQLSVIAFGGDVKVIQPLADLQCLPLEKSPNRLQTFRKSLFLNLLLQVKHLWDRLLKWLRR